MFQISAVKALYGVLEIQGFGLSGIRWLDGLQVLVLEAPAVDTNPKTCKPKNASKPYSPKRPKPQSHKDPNS